MGHEGIFATKIECDAKAGENVDTSGWTEANINDWCSQSESYINIICRYNFSDNYSGLNADVKRILSEASSNLVGIYGIIYNMNGYATQESTARIHAEDQINVLYARFQACIKVLKDQNSIDFMKGA